MGKVQGHGCEAGSSGSSSVLTCCTVGTAAGVLHPSPLCNAGWCPSLLGGVHDSCGRPELFVKGVNAYGASALLHVREALECIRTFCTRPCGDCSVMLAASQVLTVCYCFESYG